MGFVVNGQEKEEVIGIGNLLSRYKCEIISSEKLKFFGVEKDVYNVTAPFSLEGKTYIAGRVESRNSEVDSKTMFFYEDEGIWVLDLDAPVFDLQDPFISFHGEMILFGGVEIKADSNQISYVTVFYMGSSLHDLRKFAQGPVGMKDIRVSEFIVNNNGDIDINIGIFTRPQGRVGGRGRIGFMKIHSLEGFDSLKYEQYYSADLLKDLFLDEEWLGVNAVYPLKNGTLGVLGHIACLSEYGRNYYPLVFCFDPRNHSFFGMKIIARRQDLPEGGFKRPDLKNVLFSGGMVRHPDSTADLYVGVGDIEAYKIKIPDPFIEYES